MTAQVASFPALLRDVVSLSKPRITTLVVATTAGGVFLAPGAMAPLYILLTLVATAMTVGAANTLNCYLERDVDGLMARTKTRPLPAGRLPAWIALVAGLVLAVVSIPILTIFVNGMTGALATLALTSYVLVYTPMKLKSPIALFVGAIPGAIPPLMGYAAVTGRIDAAGLVLFGILFIWQIPHFLAISLFRKDDYAGAGFKIFPVVYGDRAARIHAVIWAVLLIPVSILPYPLHVSGVVYCIAAALLGVGFVVFAAWGLRRDAGRKWARGLFLDSLVYLTVLFAVLMADACALTSS